MADPYAANVSLLLPMFGDNNGTTFTDYSASPKTVTRYGDAKTSNAQVKYYWGSCALDGTGDYLSVPNGTDFNFGSASFTVEAWIRISSYYSAGRTIFSIGKSGTNAYGVRLEVLSNGQLRGLVSPGSNNVYPVTGGTVALNSWVHVALVRDGNTLRLFQNGSQSDSLSYTGSVYYGLDQTPYVGYAAENTSAYFAGYLQDVRVTKGVARYTATYIPPDQLIGEWTTQSSLVNAAPTTKTETSTVGVRSASSGVSDGPALYILTALTTEKRKASIAKATPATLQTVQASVIQYWLLADSLTFSEAMDSGVSTTLTASTSVTATDGGPVNPETSLTADDEAFVLAWAVVSSITASDTLLIPQSFQIAVSETISLQTALGNIVQLLASDIVTMTADMQEWLKRMLAATEVISILSPASQQHEINEALASALTMQTVAEIAWLLTATDVVTATDAIEDLRRAFLSVLEQITATDTVTPHLSFVMLASDTLDADDSSGAFLNFLLSTTDTVSFVGALATPSDSYQAWVLNLRTRAPYQYSPYPFNSFGTVGDTHYGLTADALYKLQGDTDDGAQIEAHIKTGLIDFGTQFQKNVTRAYLGYSADGQLYLKVTDTESGEKREVTYALNQTHGGVSEARIKLGQGVRARYWQFELANVEGSDFQIDGLDVLPVVLKRRI